MESVIVHTILKAFTKTQRVISRGMVANSRRIASLICSINRGQLLHTFDLKCSQRKNHMDLNQLNERANRCHHAMRSND